MEGLKTNLKPEVTIVPIKTEDDDDEEGKQIPNSEIIIVPMKTEEDDDEGKQIPNSEESENDEWSDILPAGEHVVVLEVLEPLVKIEEADEATEDLPQTDSQSVQIEKEHVDVEQHKKIQNHSEQSAEAIKKKEEALQKAEIRSRLEWKALSHGSVCTECGREFTALSRLRQHIETHVTELVAGKKEGAITAWSELDKRPGLPPLKARRSHTCALCGRMFIREAHLKRHILVHTGERPHRCEVCHKSFTASDDLKVHSRVHTGERPHQCHTCNKAFTTAGNLKVHLRVHSGERPYGCSSCGKCFTRSAALKKHQRLHSASSVSF